MSKLPKNESDTRFWSIMSYIRTISYEMSEHMNSIVIKCIPKPYKTASTYEFLSLIRTCYSADMLASLDAENHFTNIPVVELMKIYLRNFNEHQSFPQPPLLRKKREKLLIICTPKTKFKSITEISTSSNTEFELATPNGPTFDNLYMGELEK